MTDLKLPKTKLVFRNGDLLKLGKDDAVLASFKQDRIRGVRLETTRELGVAVPTAALFLALAVIAKIYISDPGWSWTVTVICLALVGFSALMVFGRKVVIETTSGAVGYPVADQFEEAQGFVLSLRHALEEEPLREVDPSAAREPDDLQSSVLG